MFTHRHDTNAISGCYGTQELERLIDRTRLNVYHAADAPVLFNLVNSKTTIPGYYFTPTLHSQSLYISADVPFIGLDPKDP